MSELKPYRFVLATENSTLGGAVYTSKYVYAQEDVDKLIAELKERSQWHRQKDKDIFFECGKQWGAEYIVKMKDGTTHLAYGGCDECSDGSVSTFFHFQDEDYEWEYDDIDIWYEIPDHRIDGNIKETAKDGM